MGTTNQVFVSNYARALPIMVITLQGFVKIHVRVDLNKKILKLASKHAPRKTVL